MKKITKIPTQGKRPDQYESSALIVFTAIGLFAFVLIVIAANVLCQ